MAGGKIRGVTIDIGADTSKFTSALKTTNSAISTTQKSLKDVNKLLKLDPTNTELLKQKQQLLGKQVENTKDKLTQLKEAQATMDSNGVDKNSDQYQALQREIADTQNKLKDLEDEQKKFGSVATQYISGVGDKMQELGGKVTNVGESLTSSLTVPLAAFATAAVSAFTQYDNGADTIIQKTGASGEALDEMQESMENIASSIPVTFEQAGSAIGEVNTRFGLTGDALEELSEQFLEFAELNGTDVSSSIDTVQKAMSAFGLSAEDASSFLDTLNVVGQNTGISVDTLASSMTSNAVSLKEMGYSASDAATLLGNLEKSGIDTSTVMTGLKKVVKAAMEDGTSATEEFEKALSSDADAIDIFGSKAGPQLKKAFDDGTLSIDMFTAGATSLEDAVGSVSETYENTLDPIDKFQTTMNACIPVLADIGNSIMTVLQPVLEGLCDVIENVTTWWDSLDESTQNIITTIGLVVAVVGPIVTIIGSVITGIGSLLSSVSMISGALSVLSAGPIAIVVAAIAGVIAVIALLVTHWDTVKEVASNCWTTIQNVWSVAVDFFSNLFNSIMSVAQSIWNTIQSVISTVWNTVQSLWQGATSFFSGLFSAISSTVSSVWSGIKNTITGVWNGIQGVWNGATSFFSGIWNGIVNTVSTIKDKIMQPFRDAWNGIKSLFSGTISLPKIKLPHFSVKGSLNPLNWLSSGLPSISVSWYKKAMNQPYTFNSPTLIGVGEAGSETVVGTEWLKNHTGGQTNNITIYQQPGEDVNSLVNRLEDRLNKNMRRANAW